MHALKHIAFFLVLHSCIVLGQSNYKTTDSVYLFWQEGVRIKYQDYKGPSFPNNIPVVAEVAIWTALDLPAKRVQTTENSMHFYIAALADRYRSHADLNDSAVIAIDNLYFDVAEICARDARKKISALPDSLKNSPEISAVFKTIVKEMHEKRLRMNRKFYREYYREKNKAALFKWRAELDAELKNTAEWATKPIDCHRFIIGVPLEKYYLEDLNSNPRVLLDRYEQVLAPDTWHAGFNQVSRLRKPGK